MSIILNTANDKEVIHYTKPRISQRQAFPKEEFDMRIKNVQKDIAAAGMDLLLVHTIENLCYLTGIETSGYFEYLVLAVPASGDVKFLVRNIEELNVDEYTWLDSCWTWKDGDDFFKITRRLVDSFGLKPNARIGLEYHSWFVTAQVLKGLEAALDGYQIVNSGRIVEDRRLIKSPLEQQYSRAAAHTADAGMKAVLEAACEGKTELEIAAAAYNGHILDGGQYPALPHYISSGANAELGHPSWSNRILQRGDQLRIELLGTQRRYHAGITRSIFIGTASDEMKATAEKSFEIQQYLLKELKPGVHMGELTRSVRERVTKMGVPVFARRMGYSMGIGFPPTAGEALTADFRESDNHILQPGMVFHMLWIMESDFGFSDTCLITDTGYERLTQTPDQLFIV